LSIKLCLSLPLKNKAEILLTYLSIKKWTIAPNVKICEVAGFNRQCQTFCLHRLKLVLFSLYLYT